MKNYLFLLLLLAVPVVLSCGCNSTNHIVIDVQTEKPVKQSNGTISLSETNHNSKMNNSIQDVDIGPKEIEFGPGDVF